MKSFLLKQLNNSSDTPDSQEDIKSGLDFFEHFRVLKLIYGTRNARAVVAFRIGILFFGIWIIGAALTLTDGSFYIRDGNLENGKMGFIQDPVNPFYLLALAISTYLVYLLTLRFKSTFYGTENGFDKTRGILQVADLDSTREDRYRTLFDLRLKSVTLHTSRSRYYFRIASAAAFAVFLYGSLIEPLFFKYRHNWNFEFNPFDGRMQYPVGFAYNQIKDLFVYVMLIPSIGWITLLLALQTVSLARWLQKENSFVISPSAPDRVGGMKPLGELSLLLFYIVIIQLMHFFPTSFVFGLPPSHKMIYVPYLAFAVFVFFAPLVVVRRSMREAKQRDLELTSREFNELNAKLLRLPAADLRNHSKIKKLWELIKINEERHQRIFSMPVWPYDFHTFSRFVTGILVPTALYVLQLMFDKDKILTWFREILHSIG